jgi:cytochrome c oxidase subunit 2
MMMRRALLGISLACTLTACGGLQSALAPAGPQADEIAQLSWWMFAGATLITLAILAFTALAVWGRESWRRWLAGHRAIFWGGLVFPSVVVLALLVAGLPMGIRQAGDGAADLRIRVVGEQWWWRVTYLDASGRETFETANEIRIPVGATVAFELETADVIHSFWVPALGGKLDMIPGQKNVLRLRADAPGLYRGQCAEFCGGPHALMAFYVVAQMPQDFEAWRAREARVATNDNAPGREVFFAAGCGACHSVRGTPAAGRIGPDLTHIGGRGLIAAGTVPMTRDTLAAWIMDPQAIKPHNRMPRFDAFSGQDIAALAAWLEGLK